MPARVIIPAKSMLNPSAMAMAITNAMNAAAQGAQVDFRVTVQTWKTKPEFKIENVSPYVRRIWTDNKVYIFVNYGTKPHIIRPKRAKVLTWTGTGGRAKSRPRKIKSNKGGGRDNTIVFAKIVQHPGTEAREFDDVIAEKWKKQLPEIVQRAIDSVVKA